MVGGSAVAFVPGAAPDLAAFDSNVLSLTVADLKAGTDPELATIDDVLPINQLASAAEIILWLPDGRVRVLKSRDAATVNATRDARPSDGKAPSAAAVKPVAAPAHDALRANPVTE